MKGKRMKRICALGAAMAIALTMSIAALAEPAADAAAAEPEAVETQTDTEAQDQQAQATPSRGARSKGVRGILAGQNITSKAFNANAQLTDEQKQALNTAQSAYDAAEDGVLDEMVAAGALTQDAVDSYRAQRDAQRKVAQMDTSNWTLDQIAALRQAIGRGSVNETVLAGLVSQGVLTQEDAETFKLAYGETINIWSQIDSSKATQGMITKLQEAQAAYRQALTDAGILTEARGLSKKDSGVNGKGGRSGMGGMQSGRGTR